MFSRVLSTAGVSILVVALLAACSSSGGAPTTVPSEFEDQRAASSPTAEPTPDPTGVVDAFLAFVAGPEAAMEAEVTGTIQGDGIDFAMEGALRDSTNRESYEGTVTINGVATEQRSFRDGETAYVLRDDGLWWVAEQGEVTGYKFQDLFSAVELMNFVEVEQQSEGPCWRFSVPAVNLEARFFQFAIPSAEDIVVTTTRFEIELDDAGMPMGAEIEADVQISLADGGTRRADLAYSWVFSGVGRTIGVADPGRVYEPYRDAEFGFEIGLPHFGDWTIEDSDGMPFAVSRSGYVTVRIGGWGGGDLESSLSGLDEIFGMTAVGHEPISVAGMDGFLVTYEQAFDAVEWTTRVAVLPKDQVLWLVEGGSPTAIKAPMDKVFREALTTFQVLQ